MKILLPVLMLFCLAANAQYKNPFFNTLTVEKGLPEGNIVSSLQDKFGYIWLGTQNGLVRFDGYHLKTYNLLDDAGKPVVINSVQYLFEDAKGKLWVSTFLEGIYSFNRQKDAFEKVKIDTAMANIYKSCRFYQWVEEEQSGIQVMGGYDATTGKPHTFTFDPLHNIMQHYSAAQKGKYFIPAFGDAGALVKDANKRIWFTTDSLISLFNPQTGTFDPCAVMPDSSKNITFYGGVADLADPDIILLNTYRSSDGASNTTYKQKFYQFNTKTKQFVAYIPDETQPNAIAGECLHILRDSFKRIWCTTKKGISLLNTATHTFINYPLNLPASLTDEQTHAESIAADKDGNLWLGGYFKGLFFLNVKTGIATYYGHTNTEGSLPDHNGIKKLFFDKSGTLWINMPYNGMAYLNRPRSLFNPFPINPSLSESGGKISLDDYYIYNKYDDSSFLVKDSAGLYIWNYTRNNFKRIELGNNKIYKQINDVFGAKDGTIWLASASGIFCYDPATKQTKQYKNDPKDSNSLVSNGVNILLGDAYGNIWIGTGDKGICCLNRQSGKFTRYPFIINNGTIKADNTLDDASVICLYFDSDNILWIGTNKGGLNRLDIKSGNFTSYLDSKKGLNYIVSIFEDSHHRLWAGTYLSGLFLIDKKTGSFQRYAVEDGLLYNSISGITEDKAGNIWAVTTRGLSCLNPGTKKFSNFNTYSGGGTFFDNSEALNIGVKNGLISFDPAQMKTSDIAPIVMIESVTYNKGDDNDTVLFIHDRVGIELKHNQNKVSFQYIGIHTGDASANRYAYQLVGYDKDWVQAGTQRSVTYTNLPPGNYTFKVKACNSDLVWNETGASIQFSILPPWWKTWWAYLLYGIVFIGAIYSFIAYRSAALKKENKVLEEKVELRTSQLQNSIADLKATQAQLIQSEKMASLGELTAGIAHEIQNPLNFVNNFSEVNTELIGDLINEVDNGNTEEVKLIAADIKENSEKINHHGKRADAIVKGMLQHSRKSEGKKEPTDINALCDEYLRLSYHGLRAKDKSFNATLKTDFDNSIGKININPQDMGRVILNLINNAFYAVNEKAKAITLTQPEALYEPTVTVITKRENGQVLITVEDNGNGIPQNILDKIFQPFFTTKPTGQGTGLGLSLSYDIVKAHGGEIKVKTTDGAGLPDGQTGTSFIFQLLV